MDVDRQHEHILYLSDSPGDRGSLVWRSCTGRKLKKKFEPTVREILTPTYLLRCKQMGFGIEELDLLEYGMILDMMIESGNDTVKYPKKATQAQFREFIGG